MEKKREGWRGTLRRWVAWLRGERGGADQEAVYQEVRKRIMDDLARGGPISGELCSRYQVDRRRDCF